MNAGESADVRLIASQIDSKSRTYARGRAVLVGVVDFVRVITSFYVRRYYTSRQRCAPFRWLVLAFWLVGITYGPQVNTSRHDQAYRSAMYMPRSPGCKVFKWQWVGCCMDGRQRSDLAPTFLSLFRANASALAEQ